MTWNQIQLVCLQAIEASLEIGHRVYDVERWLLDCNDVADA